MKTPKKAKKYVFTFKAGKRREENVLTQKRHFVSLFLTEKKFQKVVIFYNQKKTALPLEKHLNKLNIKTVLFDKNTTKKAYTDFVKDFANNPAVILCPDSSLKDLEPLKEAIEAVIHFDFAKSAASFALRQHFENQTETCLLVSDEDKENIEKISENTTLNFSLGRLKGHRNASIGIDFSAPHSQAKSDKAKATATKEALEPSAEIETTEKETAESPQRKNTRKNTRKTTGKKPARPAKESLEEKEQSAQQAEATPSSKEASSPQEDTEAVAAPQKRRTRRKKEEESESERLPSKRSRPRKSAIVAEIAPVEEATEVEIEIEPEDTGIRLEIEIKQAPKPKVRRTPQGRIIGMGEHTPDFMLKEIIFKNSTLHEDE